jgi:hypothetical protein
LELQSKVIKSKVKVRGGEGGEDADGGGGYVDADAIAGDAGDAVDRGTCGVDVGGHCAGFSREMS